MSEPQAAGQPVGQPDDAVPTREELTALTEANTAAAEEVARRYRLELDPMDVLMVRLMYLTEAVLGTLDEPARRAFEHRLQQTYGRSVEKMRQEGFAARMTQGVSPAGLPLPGALRTGRRQPPPQQPPDVLTRAHRAPG